MAGEDGADSSSHGHEVSRADGLTISLASQKLQAVGQRILNNPHIVEVEENLVSTCRVPLGDLIDRLLLAKDFGVPLVEATLLRQTDQNAELWQLFGVSRLVRGILWSDGRRHDNRYIGDYIRFHDMALRLGSNASIEGYGESDNEIQSYIISSDYTFDPIDNTNYHGVGMAYEDMIIHGYMPTDDPRLDLEPNKASQLLDKFDTAITPDGYWK